MRSYTIWSPQYSHFSGGIRALHILNDLLNKKGYESYLHYENKHQNENIVLYPEIISDNPLSSSNIVRWLLANSEKKDLSFEWVKGLNGDYVLTVNIIDLQIFQPKKRIRKGIGYWIGKGSQNIDLPDSAIRIGKFDPQDREVLAEILSSFEYIISFDSFTALNFEATLLGTPVFIANQTHDWSEKKLRQTEWPFYGIFWNMDDLSKAKNEVFNQYDEYKRLLQKFDNSVNEFVDITQSVYA